ncbi:hypothetical protein DSO57_1000737 [Entomophthora muscae]|nr:hypothetical protein DSO57_1000737 [Entomophthora muscae]
MINHIVVFMLGTIPFEPGFGATVHFLWPNKVWQFLEIITNEKPSAVFRLRPQDLANLDDLSPDQTVTLGISIEPLQVVEQQFQQNQLALSAHRLNNVTLPIVQKISDNLYNFVSSFVDSPSGSAQDTFIPLSSFKDWHTKLLSRLQADPNFLSK